MTLNDTNIISVQTHVAIPGYNHDQIADAKIDGRFSFFCFLFI
jgi:hypothetical protein